MSRNYYGTSSPAHKTAVGAKSRVPLLPHLGPNSSAYMHQTESGEDRDLEQLLMATNPVGHKPSIYIQDSNALAERRALFENEPLFFASFPDIPFGVPALLSFTNNQRNKKNM